MSYNSPRKTPREKIKMTYFDVKIMIEYKI